MIDLAAIKARDLDYRGAAPVVEEHGDEYLISKEHFDAVFECRKDVPALIAEVERLERAALVVASGRL